jgi:hypothetical protein
MKNYIFIFMIISIVHCTNAQGLTKSGEVNTNVALYVSNNGAIGASTFVNKNGQIAMTTVPLAVGASHQGGKIFYIFVDGEPGYVEGEIHGLIAANSDLGGTKEWGCDGTLIANIVTGVGYGNQNTINIVNNCSQLGTAARLCYDLDVDGYSDWYLPSYNELRQLYFQKSIFGMSARYWSSSQVNDPAYEGSWANGLYFANGNAFNTFKSNPYAVRPIRTF